MSAVSRRRLASPCRALRRRAVAAALLLGLAPPSAAPAEDASAMVAAHVGSVDAVPRGPGVEERLDEIRRRIARALVYPSLARWRALSGEAAVAFEIGDDGRAFGVRTVRSSGHAILDGAAERAVVAAGVLPRVQGPLEVPIRFELRERR